MKFYSALLEDGTKRMTPPDDQVTIDHVFPIGSKKRTKYKREQRPSPYVLACRGCNQERGNMEFHEFKKIKHRRIKQKCSYCKEEAGYNLIYPRSILGMCKDCIADFIRKWNPTDAIIVPKQFYPQDSRWFPVPSVLLHDVYYSYGKTFEEFKKWMESSSVPDMNIE
jgi:hypothetical protein